MDVRPSLVERGVATDLTIELPRLRPGAAPERLDVEGDGIEVLSASPAGAARAETLWHVRLRANQPPGPVALTLRVGYRDGKSVVVRHALTVVPGPQPSASPWPRVVAGALLAAALALVGLRLARRQGA